LQLRVRGVVEQKTYTGFTAAAASGQNASFFVRGGVAAADLYNDYPLTIAAPPQLFHLNRGASNNQHCDPIDYRVTLPALAATTLTFDPDDQYDSGRQIRNYDSAGAPIVVPGVAPAPSAFNGQFIQIDVEAVTLAP
jgi:hypothetical protein